MIVRTRGNTAKVAIAAEGQHLEDVIAGTNISIDKTDPLNPVISSTGGGGSMVYPGAGIALSTGSAWDTSITNNSSNWNTAYGWGNHASAGYLTSLTNGNGTTANGSAVDLGGTISTDIDFIADGTKYFRIGDSGTNQGVLDFRVFAKDYFALRAGEYSSGNYNGIQILPSGVTSGTVIESYDSDSNVTDVIVGSGTGQYYGFTVRTGNPSASTRLQIRPDGVWQVNLGSDATGDTYYRNSSGYFTRLAAGTNGHVLTLAAGIPSWAAPSGGSGLTVGTSTITSGTNTRVLYNNSGVLGEYTVSGSGNVAMTTSPVFTTPNIGTATGTASGNWSLSSGGTLTGANTITGTTTNILKGVFNSLGTTQTNGAGLWLANTTAASAGAQQHSPSLVLEGQGWKTNATAASQSVKWAIDVTPVQAAANPTSILKFKSSINGAAYSDIMTLTSGTLLQVQSIRSSNLTAISGDNLTIQPGTSAGRIDAGLFSPTGIGAFVFSSGSEVVKTSGDVGSVNLKQGFAPTSGTATYYGYGIANTVNMTGGANGLVSMLHIRPTYTAVGGDVNGIYYNPTVTSVTGVHYCFRATSGSMLIGGTTLTTNAILDLQSTSRAFIPPRMTAAQRDAIGTPSIGMVVYNTDTNVLNFYNGGAWGAV